MKYLLIVIAVFSLATTQASPLPDFPFVTVSETVTKKVVPDRAVVSFSITTFAQTSEPAKATMVDTMNQVVALAKEMGIDANDITAYDIDKQTKRKKDDDYNELEILGYEFSRFVNFELKNLDRYSELMDKLLDTDHVAGIETKFDTSKRMEIEAELIAEAAEKARSKAALMAKGLGVKLGSVYAFNEGGSFRSFFNTFGLADSYSVGSMVTGSRITMLIPKYIEISNDINVIYKIEALTE